MVVLWIVRFNDQEKSVAGGHRKIWSIEHWVIRLWKLVQNQHSQYCRKGCNQHGAFESDRNKRGPTVKGFTTNIDWIIDDFNPILHKEPAETAEQTANKNDYRQAGMRESNRFGKFFNRIRRVAIDTAIAGFVRLARGMTKFVWAFKFGHHAVQHGFVPAMPGFLR